jgi:hypothetical protein
MGVLGAGSGATSSDVRCQKLEVIERWINAGAPTTDQDFVLHEFFTSKLSFTKVISPIVCLTR